MPRSLIVTSSLLIAWAGPVPCSAEDAVTFPEGEGKQILFALCSSCHQLAEVTKFKGYYDEVQWREVVLTMATYGVPFPTAQIPILVEYLSENFGLEDRKLD